MAKVSGSYASVVKGVSEQVPQDRRPGQHYEQVNMISDPVRGLARRHGSIMKDEKIVATYDSGTYTSWLADTLKHRAFTFFVNGVEYDVIYRTTPDSQNLGGSTFAFAYNKVSGKFIPVVLGPDSSTLTNGGVSAIVNVGKYLFMSGNSIIPAYVGTDKWAAASNASKFAVWIRGGDYSRTFTVRLTKPDGSKITFLYKTPSASYQGLLDTSDIPSTATDYQKQVNDRVNAYNGQVTAWIGTAAAGISPANIAIALVAAGVAAGIDPASIQAVDGTVAIDSTLYTEISADDGGDGSLVLGVGNEVDNLDKVSLTHYAGKIVKVRPKKNSGTDALYLMAIAKDSAFTGWTEVTWKEVAGYEMLPVAPFAIGTIVNETLYIAGTPAGLTALCADATPLFKVNEVGDDITSPLPFFIGKRIDYLGLFQDRLVIGSGAVLFFSRPGDYFNWFKSSVLAVQDDDPVEMYALGSEDDTIKASVTYDRDLTLFGERKQYTVNGRQPLTPKSATIVPMASHENAIDANPVNSGNFVFYSKTRNGVSSMHQIQIGVVVDSPESYQISQQLDRYIKGTGVEIVAVTSPNCVLLRTDASRQEVYTYSYLDTATGAERLFDSWSKWQWTKDVGDVIGLSQDNGDILIYLLRHGMDKDNNPKIWVAAEKFLMDSSLSSNPYMDSIRPSLNVLVPTPNAFINPNTDTDTTVYMAYPQGTDLAFLGTDMDHVNVFLSQYPNMVNETVAGFDFPAYVTPTNPYRRDQDGKSIVIGRLTLGSLSISVSDTGGVVVSITTANGSKVVTDFTGRLLGRVTDLVGRAPIVSTTVPASIGREVREVQYTLTAKTFLPLTITAIEWVGQYFNNARRV